MHQTSSKTSTGVLAKTGKMVIPIISVQERTKRINLEGYKTYTIDATMVDFHCPHNIVKSQPQILKS
jgi:hypothetical protein